MAQAEAESVASPATLFLPLAERRATWLACSALFAFYAATMARDLSFYDSGELSLAAIELGLGHPPGQPLHTLIGFALAQLPLWSPLVGVTLVSAIPGALALIPATSLAQTLAGRSPHARYVPFLLAALGLHASVWEPATRVEVYALATLLALWAVAKLAVRVDRKSVFIAAVALGLSASANPMTALCVALGLAPAVLARIARRELPASALLSALGGGLLGLLPYAYVPIAAQHSDAFVWGAPRDATSLWHYLSGQDFARSRTLDAATFAAHLGAWLLSTLPRGLLPWLILGLVGHTKLARERSAVGPWLAPLTLGSLAALIASNAVWSLDVPDYDGYLATSVWLCGAGAAALFSAMASEPLRQRGAVVMGCALAASALITRPHVFERTRHADRTARVLGEIVLDDAPKNAILIASSDTFAGPLYYLQEVERQRRDVVIVAYGLASSSWHWAHIAKRHPALQPFELRGAGGRDGRLRRFVAANAARPVLVETSALANMLDRKACGHALYLLAAAECPRSSDHKKTGSGLPKLVLSKHMPAREELATALRTLADGSPGTRGALTAVAYERGVSAWRAGKPQDAYAWLLSGVPGALQPLPRESTEPLSALPPLGSELPAWRRPAALGDPARNLFVAALMLEAAGLHERAEDLRAHAAALGLPEAL